MKTKYLHTSSFKKIKKFTDAGDLIIGQFELIHKSHFKLISSSKDFSFLIFTNNPNKTNSFYHLRDRIKFLKKYKPNYIFIYDIKKQNLSADQFIFEYLNKINPKTIIVGSDFHFGKNKSGDVELLKKHFDVNVMERFVEHSTSKIFDLIASGKIEEANKISHHPLTFCGKIIHGNQMGRKLGYPTANIIIKKNKILVYGSYVSEVVLNGEKYYGLTFYGNSKTVDRNKIFLETFIFDFDKDVYGQEITVTLLSFIRPLEKCNNLDELIEKINDDYLKAKTFFKV